MPAYLDRYLTVIERHLLKLRKRDDISFEEERIIRSSICELRDYSTDFTFIKRYEELKHSTLLLEGIACRFKDLRNGERQISELHVPGDFADLHSFTLKHLDHDLTALTPCKVALVPHARLKEITEQFPHLARVYWFATNLDAAIHREWELSLGRRSAISRLAHLFCELHVRLGIVGLAEDTEFLFRLTQQDLADCLGLTVVHVNRVLKDLRERGVLEFKSGRVQLCDLAALREIAEFDPAYLYLDLRSR